MSVETSAALAADMTTPQLPSATSKMSEILAPWPLLAVLSGVLIGLSQPVVIESITGKTPLDPTGLTGLLALFGLVPALFAVDVDAGRAAASGGGGPKRAYAIGFVTFFVAFFIIINWLVTTIHVYGGAPLWAALPVLLLLTAAMGAYVAASFAVSRVIGRFFGWPLWMTLPPVISGVELLRNVGPLGGFPWGAVGHSFATVPVFMQAASVVGVTGLTFLTVLLNAALATVVSSWWQGRGLDRRAAVVAAVTLVGWAGFGAIRLQDDVLGGPSVRVGLLQPNVNEGLADLKHEPKSAILERFHRLEKVALDDGADVVLWPEGSFPTRGFDRDLQDFRRVQLVPDGSKPPQASVVGVVATGRLPGPDGKKQNIRQNSAFVVDDQLKVHGRFDKTHLVPFGEYVPWPFGALIRQFIPLGTTTPGNALQPIDVVVDGQTMRIGVTICYEGVFPEVSRAIANNGATFMANLTDDRWYGVSGMATQHLLMYALRAVETGRPVARSTNTGISAWVDIHGGVHKKTGMYEEAVVVDDVPLKTIDTLYLRLGDWLALLSLLASLACWFIVILNGRDVMNRPKSPATLVLGVVGAVSFAAGFMMWWTSDGLDEALSTKAMLLAIAGLLVGFGALSHRSWGRRAVAIVGLLCVACGVVATVISGVDKVLLVVAGLGLFFLSKKHVAHRDAPATARTG